MIDIYARTYREADWRCDECGQLVDSPGHEMGCSSADAVERRAAMRRATDRLERDKDGMTHEKECAHPQVGLRTAAGEWRCADCGEPVERRSALGASVRRALSIIGRSLTP